MKKKFIETGKIVGTHGVKGMVRIQPWSDTPEFICDFEKFYLDDKGCLTFARRLLAWINEQGWNDGLNHWEEVEEKIRLLFTNGTVSMSRREISEFIDTFKEVLINNTVFAWIFGNKTTRMMR